MTKLMQRVSPRDKAILTQLWSFKARDEQLPPPGNWYIWALVAGRGFGKTRTGAEYVNERVDSKAWRRVALVGATEDEVVKVMLTGESGLITVSPSWNKPEYKQKLKQVHWPNGAIAEVFTAERPGSLRGPQFHGAWVDELAKWRYLDDVWDMLEFGVRLGDDPRIVVTTTPRPVKLLKRIMADPDTVVTGGSTFDNAANLSSRFLERMKRRYEGTRIGRQELYAAMLDDNPRALWTRGSIDDNRVDFAPPLARIAVGIDPGGSKRTSDATGIVVFGRGFNGHGYVLDDLSLLGKPNEWAAAALNGYVKNKADILTAEVNHGGEMVEFTIKSVANSVDPPINYRYDEAWASRGKATRADPIAALYLQNKVHHVGAFPELEDELCDWIPGEGDSPNRLDALVWAATKVMVAPNQPPRDVVPIGLDAASKWSLRYGDADNDDDW